MSEKVSHERYREVEISKHKTRSATKDQEASKKLTDLPQFVGPNRISISFGFLSNLRLRAASSSFLLKVWSFTADNDVAAAEAVT